METLNTESLENTPKARLAEVLGNWATGDWWKDKFYNPTSGYAEWQIDFTTPDFCKDALFSAHDSFELAA